MLDTFLGLGLTISLLAYLLDVDEELAVIKSAAQGKVSDVHMLAKAYWNKYSATHVPKSKWLMMNRHEKSEVLKKREEFQRYFAEFDPVVQAKLQSVRPRDLGSTISNRLLDQLSVVELPSNRTIGIILSVGARYGFVRPIKSWTSYFFQPSDILERRIKELSVGDIVTFELSQNNIGLCAKGLFKFEATYNGAPKIKFCPTCRAKNAPSNLRCKNCDAYLR